MTRQMWDRSERIEVNPLGVERKVLSKPETRQIQRTHQRTLASCSTILSLRHDRSMGSLTISLRCSPIKPRHSETSLRICRKSEEIRIDTAKGTLTQPRNVVHAPKNEVSKTTTKRHDGTQTLQALRALVLKYLQDLQASSVANVIVSSKSVTSANVGSNRFA